MASHIDFRHVAEVAWEAKRAANIQGAIATDPGAWESQTQAVQDAAIASVAALAHGARMRSSETLAAVKGTASAKTQEVFDWVALAIMRVGR